MDTNQYMRWLMDLAEGSLVSFNAHQKEPTTLCPDIHLGDYTIKAIPKGKRVLEYWVSIEGPDRNPDDRYDIRRYAAETEPEKILGLPDMSGSPEDNVAAFSAFAKNTDIVSSYTDKVPGVRLNPQWVIWRRHAIARLAKQIGLS